MSDLAAYGGLFLAALVAATILPAQSEALLVGLLLGGEHPAVLLVLAASLGNVAGSAANWWLGRSLERFKGRRWFPVSAAGLARAQRWFGRFGLWSLLLAWVPVVGDPLTVVAGVLRVPFWRFLLLVALGKVGRYVLLAWASTGLG